LAAHGLFLPAKAKLGQLLLLRAWHASANSNADAHPWPWADTWPVARLSSSAHDVSFIVLAGAHGEALAWGPGHVSGTALPGQHGNAVIGGHRDTSFRFLKNVGLGDDLEIERPDGVKVSYQVRSVAVVDHRDPRPLMRTGDNVLTLITCFPFDDPRPNPTERYVVHAVERQQGG
jgi:sortase A